MKILISFGSNGYENALYSLARSGEPHFDKIIMYRPDDIRDFLDPRLDSRLFKDSRGYGYWSWKPYIIAKTLEDYDKHDPVVMYCDSTIHFLRSPEEWLKLAHQHGGCFFKQKHLQKTYTKGDCFQLMEATEQKYKDFNQLNAAFSIWTKTGHSLAIEWMMKCLDYNIVSDLQTGLHPNDPTFVAHRHDQSIISILLAKYNQFMYFPIVDDISQFGPGMPILNHHRGL